MNLFAAAVKEIEYYISNEWKRVQNTFGNWHIDDMLGCLDNPAAGN